MATINRCQITGVVLAGGQGRRMGGVDKGLLELAGKPMAAWAIQHLAPQVGHLMISANRSQWHYLQLADKVVADEADGKQTHAGPLAGILAAMRAANTPYLLTLPCDAPFAPPDLGTRLCEALRQGGGQIAIAEAGGRQHPLHALVDTSLETTLRATLARGERKVIAWCKSQGYTGVNFDDQPEVFININTPDELARQNSRLTAGQHP